MFDTCMAHTRQSHCMKVFPIAQIENSIKRQRRTEHTEHRFIAKIAIESKFGTFSLHTDALCNIFIILLSALQIK